MAEISKDDILQVLDEMDADTIEFVPEGVSTLENDFGSMMNINLPDPALVNFWRDR